MGEAQNQQVVLAARPTGIPQAEHFEIRAAPRPISGCLPPP